MISAVVHSVAADQAGTMMANSQVTIDGINSTYRKISRNSYTGRIVGLYFCNVGTVTVTAAAINS